MISVGSVMQDFLDTWHLFDIVMDEVIPKYLLLHNFHAVNTFE